ncbi:hypothetical protein Tco_0006743 [Tanacetum coccineum]
MIHDIASIEKYLIEAILHKHEIQKRVELQSNDVQISPVQALEASLVVTECCETKLENSSSVTSFSKPENVNKSFNKERSSSERNHTDDDIGPLYDSDIITEVPHSSYDTFENVFAHGIQSHEQPESNPDTYMVNENNSNVISNIPYMDLDIHKEEHDYVDYEQHRAFFASLINNLKCDVEKCNEVNREVQ